MHVFVDCLPHPPPAARRRPPLSPEPTQAYILRKCRTSKNLRPRTIVDVLPPKPPLAETLPQEQLPNEVLPQKPTEDAATPAAVVLDVAAVEPQSAVVHAAAEAAVAGPSAAPDGPLPERVGPWRLLSTGYRHQLRQDPDATYGPLVFGCGQVVVRTYEGIRYPVHHVETFDPPIRICDNDVIDLTTFLTRAIGTGDELHDYVYLHDLRFLWPNPSRAQLAALGKFVASNKRKMDDHLKCIAIVLVNPLVRKFINFFLWLFKPAQPAKVFADLEEGFAFLREHCGPKEECGAE